MNQLIIHPKDSSTDFLKIAYKTLKHKTVVSGIKTKEEVSDMMMAHKRIVMLGHGSPMGLFSIDQFPGVNEMIIDKSMVDILKTKEDNVYIWCNADEFVNEQGLKGFFTGMFISEVLEGYFCGFPKTTQKVVDDSNFQFCKILSKYIEQPKEYIYENVRREYKVVAENNPIAMYNCERLYFK